MKRTTRPSSYRIPSEKGGSMKTAAGDRLPTAVAPLRSPTAHHVDPRPTTSSTPSDGSGYALIVLMMTITLLLVSLTVVLPDIYVQDQREKEAELIFRGQQYARAVYLFRQKFQRYPASVKELIQTNKMRFLRKRYKDPLSRNGKWRFVHSNGQGVLIDSETVKGQPGMGGMPGTSGMGTPGMGTSGMGTSGMGTSGMGTSGMGENTTQPLAGTEEDQAEAKKKADEEKKKRIAAACSGEADSADSSGSSGLNIGSAPSGGLSIAGVASCSMKASLRIWNQKDHYDEWEFMGVAQGGAIPGVTAGPLGIQPGGVQPTGMGGTGTAPGVGPGTGTGLGSGGGILGSGSSGPGSGPGIQQGPSQPVEQPPEDQNPLPPDENPPPEENPPN